MDDDRSSCSLSKGPAQPFPIVTPKAARKRSDFKSEGPFGVILGDMLMPGMTASSCSPRLNGSPRIPSDHAHRDEEKQTAVEAINEGRIFRFLSKPCPPKSWPP